MAKPTASRLAEQIRSKGWTIRDAATYLGVSRSRLYEVFAMDEPPRLWTCAVDGMPKYAVKAQQEVLRLRANHVPRSRSPSERPALQDPAEIEHAYSHVDEDFVAPPEVASGLEVGDIVIAIARLQMVEPGEEAVITGFEELGEVRLILVQTDTHQIRVVESVFFDFFVETGRVCLHR